MSCLWTEVDLNVPPCWPHEDSAQILMHSVSVLTLCIWVKLSTRVKEESPLAPQALCWRKVQKHSSYWMLYSSCHWLCKGESESWCRTGQSWMNNAQTFPCSMLSLTTTFFLFCFFCVYLMMHHAEPGTRKPTFKKVSGNTCNDVAWSYV